MSDRPRPHPLVELTRARLVEFLREPEAVFWTFGFPVLLALALGIAFRARPMERIPVAVVTNSPAAGWVAETLTAANGFDVRRVSPAEAAALLRRGVVDLTIEAPPGRPLTGRANEQVPPSPSPVVTYRFDANRSEGRAARLAAHDALRRELQITETIAAHDETVSTPGSRYIDFLIPGLIGLNLMGSGMWGIGFAVVYARARKLLKRFAATPMRRSHYLLSFMLSRLVLLVAEVGALVGFGWLLFGVSVRGSILDLAVVTLLGALVFAGLGLLVAARPRTIEAVSGWMNLVMLPMWLGSGTFFSYERFPPAVQPFIKVLPLTAVNDALRTVMTDGAGLGSCGFQLAALVLWAIASFALAVRLFRWQ